MEKFGDPEFLTHATAARLYTLIAHAGGRGRGRPAPFTPYAEALRDHVDDLRRMVARRRPASQAGKPRSDVQRACPSSRRPSSGSRRRPRRLDRRRAALARTATACADAAGAGQRRLDAGRAGFLLPDGLPGRPWFQHAVYAPGADDRLRQLAAAGRPPGDRARTISRHAGRAGRPALVDRHRRGDRGACAEGRPSLAARD